MDNRTDSELAALAARGDDKAFRVLMERYMASAMNFARQYAPDRDELEDVVQDSFFKAWKNLKRFDLGKNFKPWLFTIVRNTALDYIKKKRATAFSAFENEQGEISFSESLASDEPSQTEEFEKSEITMEILESMNDLHPEHKAVIVMHYNEDMTFEEIAVIVGKPMNTVKSWHRRALIKMRPRLNGLKDSL